MLLNAEEQIFLQQICVIVQESIENEILIGAIVVVSGVHGVDFTLHFLFS